MVRTLYGDSLTWEQRKRRLENGQSKERKSRADLHLRLQHERGLPLQSLHLQELQLSVSTRAHLRLAAGGAPPLKRFAVKSLMIVVCSSLAITSAPAAAQHSDMPGMHMPMPSKPAHQAKNPSKPVPSPATPMHHEQASMNGMEMQRGPHEMNMMAALGPYPEERESSATA
jgi:hypothetical protein